MRGPEWSAPAGDFAFVGSFVGLVVYNELFLAVHFSGTILGGL